MNPNCVETVSDPFDRMDRMMRDIDNAIFRQQIAIKSFTETVQKFRSFAYHSNGLRSLDSVRYWDPSGLNPANLIAPLLVTYLTYRHKVSPRPRCCLPP